MDPNAVTGTFSIALVTFIFPRPPPRDTHMCNMSLFAERHVAGYKNDFSCP